MPRSLYYNPSTYDGNSGGGYGRAAPAKASGLETVMGSSETGIYSQPTGYTEEEIEEIDDYVDDITRKKIKNATNSNSVSGVRRNQRFDASSYVKAFQMLEEKFSMPAFIKNSIVPFPANMMYPAGPSKHLGGSNSGGFSGLPVGTGAANQAFRTTGPFRRTGTLAGTAHAPKPVDDIGQVEIYNLKDMEKIDKDELNIIKHTLRMKKILNYLNAVDRRKNIR